MFDVICPQCGSTMVVFRPKKQQHLCDNCDHQWQAESASSLVEQSPAVLAMDQNEDLAALVQERFPFPIAWGYCSMLSASSPSLAVDCAFYTYTALLRLGALIFLAQFLHSERQNPQAAKVVQNLRNPTLESWHTVLCTLRKHFFPPLRGKAVRFAPFAEGGPFSAGLAEAALRLPRLDYQGQPVHARIRAMRNERAHGAPWDADECRQRLPEIRHLLDAALGLFACFAEVSLVRESPNGLVRLMGSRELFEEESVEDAFLEDLFAESDTVVSNRAGDLLPLYPLFLLPGEPLVQGYTEPLLVFDGHGQKVAYYLGVRSRSERQDTLARYHDLLRSKNIDPGFTLNSPLNNPQF